jgi:hypothetical protein
VNDNKSEISTNEKTNQISSFPFVGFTNSDKISLYFIVILSIVGTLLFFNQKRLWKHMERERSIAIQRISENMESNSDEMRSVSKSIKGVSEEMKGVSNSIKSISEEMKGVSNSIKSRQGALPSSGTSNINTDF